MEAAWSYLVDHEFHVNKDSVFVFICAETGAVMVIGRRQLSRGEQEIWLAAENNP